MQRGAQLPQVPKLFPHQGIWQIRRPQTSAPSPDSPVPAFPSLVRERPEALTVLHAGAGWGPQDPTGLEYGALLARIQALILGPHLACLPPHQRMTWSQEGECPFFMK